MSDLGITRAAVAAQHEHLMGAMGYRGAGTALAVAAGRARSLTELLDRQDYDSARGLARALELDLRLAAEEEPADAR